MQHRSLLNRSLSLARPCILRKISWTDSGTSMTFLGNFTRLATTFSDTSQIDFTQTYKQVVLATSQLVGVSDKIVSVCRSGDIIYIGGQISGLSNNPTVSNLFAATLNNRSVTINDMQGGLSAPVSALACVGSTLVWATSNTLANLSMIVAPGVVDAGLLSCLSGKNGWVMPATTGTIEFQLGASITISAVALQNLVDYRRRQNI
ncbi:hypothetical protein BSLG_007079 [Batrachochytrium salamandrivorans]|nr:hypothetical protein BSLG_007079 [Batrachochytrium salamandrivorans]